MDSQHPSVQATFTRLALCALVVLATTARGQLFDEGSYDPDWLRNVRLGAVGGFNIKTKFNLTGGQFKVSGAKKGVYDDGYVIKDPKNTADDFTSNWGYNDSSQYDSGAQTLTMHQTTSYTPTSGSGGKTEDAALPGVDLEYGRYIWRWERVRLGWNTGLDVLFFDISEKHTLTADVNRSAFTFDTGPHVLFPPAGYQGQPGGDGINIHSTPTPATGDFISGAKVTGKQTLDAELFTLRLGPALFWDLNDYIGLSFGAGPAVGLVYGDIKFDESIDVGGNIAPNKGSVSGTDFVYGGYVNATLTYHTVRNGDFYVGVEYMPLGNAKIGGGGRQAKMNLSGAIYVSAGVNWPF